MRPEEYLALRWSDLQGREVSVQQIVQFNRKGGGYYFDQPKTAKSRRRISIAEDLQRQLHRHRIDELGWRMRTKGMWLDLDLVFPNGIGRPETLTNLRRRFFHPVLEQCGLADRGLTLYSLRHTCATLLLLGGANPKTVADRLGHSSVVLTLDTYSHVLPHIQAEATNILRNAMRKQA